jgi:co-chaperonin GroES (HSP10)
MRNLVLCEALDNERTTAAGVILPSTSQGRPRRALVLAVGARTREVVAGNTVQFDPYKVAVTFGKLQAAGTPAALPGDKFLISEDDIFWIET